MRSATGTIASLVLTIGALLLLLVVGSSDNVTSSGRRPPKSSYLRSGNPSRKLEDSSSSSSSYTGDYATNDGSSSAATDDTAAVDDYNAATDDASSAYTDYYNANANYQADGNSYNGRDQDWSGYTYQTYTDDEEPEIDVETYADVDRWSSLKVGALSGSETLQLVGLATLLSLSMIFFFMLASGFNVIHLCQLYCNCCGAFGHIDEKTGEVIEEGFVKLGDY